MSKRILLLVLCTFALTGCKPDRELSTAKDITSFTFYASINPGLSDDIIGTISGTSITATVPFGTDVTALKASFTTTGVSVTVNGAAQTSGLTANDFTNTLTYTVTAEDGSTKDYAVSMNVEKITRDCLIQMIKNNEDVTKIDTSGITDMSRLCYSNKTFNQDISLWDVSNVTDMSWMFFEAESFNQNISLWDVSNVTNMNGMFSHALAFNQPIGSWNTARVTNMSSMFNNAEVFNQDISLWNTASVTGMDRMFSGAAAFNQSIDSWNVSNVSSMHLMFWNADAFNQSIGSWNVSNVTNMSEMFLSTAAFNQDISLWNTAKVTDMRYMFYNAAAFNQDISSWAEHVSESIDHSYFSYGSCPLTTENHPYESWND